VSEHQQLDRRQFLGASLAGGIAAVGGLGPLGRALGSTQPATANAALQGRPNVLFLIVDDLNSWVGAFGGHPNARTPHIDRLCARGVTFEQAFAPAPLCNPCRAAVMSGLLPARTGVYNNSQPMRLSPVTADCVTLTQHFMKHGYVSLGAGKIHHSSFPDPASFDDWDPCKDGAKADRTKGYHAPKVSVWAPIAANEDQAADHKIADYGVAQLQRRHDRPFFLSLGFRKPHLPWIAPQRFFDLYPPDQITLPTINEHDLDDMPPIARSFARRQSEFEAIRQAGKWPEAVGAYLACVSFVDEQIGRVLDALDASPYARNTMIVFWGDHGWHLGQKLTWRKLTLWEEACRAPLAFAVPGLTPPGGRCPRPAGFIDLYPTLSDLCGLPVPGGLDGVSLRPLLQRPNGPWDRPALTDCLMGNRSVRSRRWRYTRYSDGSEELYDHDADPLEWRNLAGESIFADVRAELARYIPATFIPNAPAQEDSDE